MDSSVRGINLIPQKHQSYEVWLYFDSCSQQKGYLYGFEITK